MKILSGILVLGVVLGLLSLTRAQDGCSAIGEIRDVVLQVNGPQLMVLWQEPTNVVNCGFSNLVHTVKYEAYSGIQEVSTPSYFVLLDYDPYTCVPGVITITLSADGVTGSTYTENFYSETTAIENLAIQQDSNSNIMARWEIPTEGTEFCQFVYHINYVDPNGENHEFTTTDLEYNLGVSLSSCQQASLTVTPYHLNEYKGVSASASYEGAINEVRNYVLSTNLGDAIANFDPPAGIENCDITYEVRESETACYTKQVNVAAYNGRIYSKWVSEVIEVEVSAVENLQASIADRNIQLNWIEPKSAASCSVTYAIDVNGEIVVVSGSSGVVPASSLSACVASNVTVIPVSNSGKKGVAAYVEVTPELGVVQDLALRLEDNVVVASWSAPENSDQCELSYLLEYANESGVHWYVTEDNSYSFAYASCVDVSLVVVAHGADGSESGRASVKLAANC